MSFKAEYKGYEQMTDEDWAVYGYKPSEDDGWCTFLVISRNGKVTDVRSDATEPEDATFGRTFSWVAEEIESAYEAGLADGAKQ